MNGSVTKQAYARGIGELLQEANITQIPTPELFKQACLIASEAITVEPAVETVPHGQAVKVAELLQAFNSNLQATGKTASAGHGVRLSNGGAPTAYGDLIRGAMKLAMAPTITGAGTDKQNLLSDSVNAEAQLDGHRPENYALVGQGNANIKEPQAARVGTEQPHPLQPTNVGGAGSNSVVDATKAASLQDALRKLAMGTSSTIDGKSPEQQNLLSDSVNAEAKMDVDRRPENYANVGQGNANINEPQSANVGEEQAHPHQPMHAGAGTNSVVDATKSASSRWQRHFEETAREIVPHLPGNMGQAEKVAAVKECMALEPHEQQLYLQKVAQIFAPQQHNETVGSLLNSLNSLQG